MTDEKEASGAGPEDRVERKISRKLVVNCGQLLTMDGAAGPRTGDALREISLRRDAALLIENGRVKAVGEYEELRPLANGAEVLDAEGRVVMPGFVDAHTHVVFGGTRIEDFEARVAGRTYQEIAAAGGGIASTVAKTRAASEVELLAQAKRHAMWMLRGGTTTIEAKSGYGLSLTDELKMLRVLRRLGEETPLRVEPTLLAAHTVPPEYRANREAYVRLVIEEIVPAAKREGLARFCDVFCEEHAFDLSESRRVMQAAKDAGLELRMHVEQFAADGGAALAAELGARTADHLEATVEEGMRALAGAGVQPVLLPASVFALSRSEYPKARRMIELGLAPVLATDFNPGSSPTVSMPFVISLAALYLRMLPAEAVVAATWNAAVSLGLEGEVGVLREGSRADLVIHECKDYRELAYFLATPVRPRVFVAGEEVAV